MLRPGAQRELPRELGLSRIGRRSSIATPTSEEGAASCRFSSTELRPKRLGAGRRDLLPSKVIEHRIAFAYRRGVRPWLPGETVRCAGIPICYDRRRGDSMVPASWTDQSEQLTDQPDYEATLIAGLNETIRPGDSVVVVGGGFGVTAVIAALRTGPSGMVQCFEGSRKHVSFVQQTATRNGVTNLTVRHAVVAKAIGV
jgi:hypothetical protein